MQLDNGTTVEAKAFVLATGSEAVRPQPLQDVLGDRLITTDELFYLPELPRSMAIVGLGPIGLEMGVALTRLGCQVVGSNRSRKLGQMDDPEVNTAAMAHFSALFPLVFGEPVQAQRRSDGRVDFQAGSVQAQVDWVLAAAGRAPRVGELALDQAGAQWGEKGRLRWDAVTQQLTGIPLFVAGDVSGDRPLMHEAAVGSTIVAQHALRHLGLMGTDQALRQRSAPLSIVFSDPDLAWVGQRFAKLPPNAVVATTHGSGNSRSQIMQAPEHLLRLYADATSRKFLGASIFCAGGEHLANQLAWAVQRGETVDILLDLPYYHPTVEEMIDNALKALRREFHQRSTSTKE